jgi:hypothetical protein
MIIVGIGHKKYSGKDTLGAMLYECMEHSMFFARITHFADALYWEVANACGVTVEHIKENKEVFRPIMQWWGTEFRRRHQGNDNYWVDQVAEAVNLIEFVSATKNSVKCIIIPDVRFKNEADWIKSKGGILIKISRPSIQAIDTHPSEIELNDYTGWDTEILNDGSKEQLLQKARGIINGLIIPKL